MIELQYLCIPNVVVLSKMATDEDPRILMYAVEHGQIASVIAGGLLSFFIII